MRSVIIMALTALAQHASSFNLSPTPNVIFRKPDKTTFMKQYESSYFGYAINLRTNSILVGAPKAQSSVEIQKNINSTGAVYKCTLDSGKCSDYNFDSDGNVGGTLKDFQMLGASMDGLESEADKFVVCAPKLNLVDHKIDPKTDLITENWYTQGVCYVVENSSTPNPHRPNKMAPVVSSHMMKNLYTFNYHYAESGFSSHISNDQREIVIGCPGVDAWRGSILRYTLADKKKHIPNTRLNDEFDRLDHTYFGYAVSSISVAPDKLLYVASAPRNKNLLGDVFVFDIVYVENPLKTKLKVHSRLSGGQMGDYFGYAILADDFNDDGYVDLAISAPMYKNENEKKSFDRGAVYVFLNDGDVSNFLKLKIS